MAPTSWKCSAFPSPTWAGLHHPAVLAVIETMERTVEAPLGRCAMARLASVSERHLDRLFLEKRGLSSSAQYRAIRLAHGRRLLRQSPMGTRGDRDGLRLHGRGRGLAQ